VKVMPFAAVASAAPKPQSFEWARLHAMRKSLLEKANSTGPIGKPFTSDAAATNPKHEAQASEQFGLSRETAPASQPDLHLAQKSVYSKVTTPESCRQEG
jgi:hypothetical protein